MKEWVGERETDRERERERDIESRARGKERGCLKTRERKKTCRVGLHNKKSLFNDKQRYLSLV